MQENLYYFWKTLLTYPSSAFVILLIILIFLFLVVIHMQILFFRFCAMVLGAGLFIGLGYLLWPKEDTNLDLASSSVIQSTLDIYTEEAWQDTEQVFVVSLSSLLQDNECTFEKKRQLKSMKLGFFIPLAQSYDLLLFKQGLKNFMLQVRERKQGHILKTINLYLEQPVVFKIDGQHYQVFYEYTDGVASVISVTPCHCQKST